MNTRNKLTYMCHMAIGTALYFVLSMVVKIPIIGHISLDLGYIVLAIYCYMFGGVCGAFVGGVGCTLVSVISSGWLPYGWLPGNLLIGYVCGHFYTRDKSMAAVVKNICVTLVAVFVGIVCIKTAIEVMLFKVPPEVKLTKNFVAFIMDALVMIIGLSVAPLVNTKK